MESKYWSLALGLVIGLSSNMIVFCSLVVEVNSFFFAVEKLLCNEESVKVSGCTQTRVNLSAQNHLPYLSLSTSNE